MMFLKHRNAILELENEEPAVGDDPCLRVGFDLVAFRDSAGAIAVVLRRIPLRIGRELLAMLAPSGRDITTFVKR